MEEEKREFQLLSFADKMKKIGKRFCSKAKECGKWFTNIDNIIFVLMIIGGFLITFFTKDNIDSCTFLSESKINGIKSNYSAVCVFVITLATIIQVYMAFSFKSKHSLGTFIILSFVTLIILICYVYFTLSITSDKIFTLSGNKIANGETEFISLHKIKSFITMTISVVGMLVGNIMAAFRINFKYDKRNFD